METTPATGPTFGHDFMRGWHGRCPACGEGKLFGKYLKVARECDKCGEPFYHHRADDFPAYIVIIILGHIIVPLMVEVEMHFMPPMWVHALLWLPLACLLTWLLLPRVKGAIVAIQWRAGMHGFRSAKVARQEKRVAALD